MVMLLHCAAQQTSKAKCGCAEGNSHSSACVQHGRPAKQSVGVPRATHTSQHACRKKTAPSYSHCPSSPAEISFCVWQNDTFKNMYMKSEYTAIKKKHQVVLWGFLGQWAWIKMVIFVYAVGYLFKEAKMCCILFSCICLILWSHVALPA